MKKVLITGSTGMVGRQLLHLCLGSAEVYEVVALVRKATNTSHLKYKEVLVSDFMTYESYLNAFQSIDIIFYCLGAYTGTLPPDAFRKVNVDYPLALAKSVYKVAPNAIFCLLSGQGADRTEKSNLQFARDKGAIENALSIIGFKSFYTFRPGYIYPTNQRKEPNFFYRIFRILYPIVKLLGPNYSITDKELAKVIFEVGMKGYRKEILENKEMRAIKY